METIEYHPLEPFLPPEAKILLLGSFPPKKERWSMEFFYPNFQNDMWRIMGLLFFADKYHFVDTGEEAVRKKLRRFDKQRIEAFCTEKGIALYDTARAVHRLKDNASDKFLEVRQHTDIGALLDQIPQCRTVITTGEKATQILAATMQCDEPPTGGHTGFTYNGRTYTFYRMPSSSRAYPLSVEKKAAVYSKVFSWCSEDFA